MRNDGFLSRLDERNRSVLGKICTILYFITIYALVGDILYRQIVLHQNPGQFEDIAIIFTANVFGFISLMLFFGGVPVGRFSFKSILAGYAGFLALGLGYVAVKYRSRLSECFLDKAVIVFSICTLITAAALLVAWIGKRRIDRTIE